MYRSKYGFSKRNLFRLFDAIGTMALGDLTKQSILEAWNGGAFEEMRVKVLAGRDAVPLCRHCDTLVD